MNLIDWKDLYSVNIAEVDGQHKKLVGFINELHRAMLMGTAKEEIGKILTELVNYTVYHFGTEEKLFDQYAYPDSELHKKQHKDLTDQVLVVQKKFENGEKVITIDVLNFLRDWLHEHIVGSDKLFGPYLNSKGVS